jgi:hypothetical protein
MSSQEKPPIRRDYFESECGCKQWYESIPGGPVEELTEFVEYCAIHDVESGSA